MGSHKLLNNFTGGEVSPQLDARIDLQKYETSCRQLQNMRPLPWGGARFRSGTLYIGNAKYPDRKCRLLPFNYNTTTTYIIEMGHLYIRFVKNGAQVIEGEESSTNWVNISGYTLGSYVLWNGVIYKNILAVSSVIPPAQNAQPQSDLTHWMVSPIYEISTIYDESEVFAVQFKEINDVLYLVHANHPPQKLARVSATNWTIGEVPWKYPALLDENLDATKTLQLVVTPAASGFVIGNTYKIVTVGTTDFTLIGATANTVGLVFTATGSGSGTGTALQTTGSGVWLYSSGFNAFNASHVGSYWEIRHLRDASSVELDIGVTSGSYTTSSIKVKGDWTMTTTERWWGTLTIERSSDNGVTWEIVRSFSVKADRNINASGTQDTEALFRMKFVSNGDPYGASVWTGTAPNSYVGARATFEVGDAYVAGLVRITAVNSGTWAIVDVINEVERGDVTWIWSEGAWSGFRGYPRAIGLYEQRLLFASTTYKPNTIWGSTAADFENFTYSDLDDAAVSYQFADTEQNPIQWLNALVRIHAGTTGGEYAVSSGNTDEPMTPSNVTVRRQSSYGSDAIPALSIDNGIIFLQRQGRRLREMREMGMYSNQSDFQAPDLTLLAEHITEGGITQMDFGRLPDPLVYTVRSDGVMPVMTYNREQNITAWARFVTQGSFESVAAIYGSPSDVVYVVVNRTVNGATARYIEAFTAELADKTNGVYVDCAAAITNASPLAGINGLTWLKNMAVTVVADGQVITGKTVDGSGGLMLDIEATVVRVGLPYIGILKPMKIDMQMANGTSQGRKRSISELCIRFKDSLGCTYGNALTENLAVGDYASQVEFRENDDPMDASPPLFTGDVVLNWDGGADLSGDILISQQQPLPMTVLGLFAEFNVFGD
jgi:hypothetical protein